jgi:uncharacterized protein (DUF885 family)
MSEPVHTSETPATGAPEPAELPTPEQPKSPAEPPAEPKPTETVDYWKQRARQNEAQAKANADAAKRLKEIEDRDLSELQKAQRDREEALTRLQEIEREALRNRVALAKGLPAEIAATLNGSNEEELAAHADRLIAWRSNLPPTTPRPDPGQGARPTTPELEAEQEYLKFFPDEAKR